MDLIINNVYKQINNNAILTDVSLKIKKGNTFALLGPNGAGKTTLIRIILGLYEMTKGEIYIDGVSIKSKEYNKKKNKINFVLDNLGLFKDLSPWENIEFFDRIYNPKSTKIERKKRIENILKEIDLLDKSKEDIRFFSRGMKQRLAIGRTLVNTPSLLILDEPFKGLDVEGQVFLIDYIKMLKKSGCTIFISSHDLSSIEKVCDTIAFIKCGKIIEFDKYENLNKKMSSNVYSLKVKNYGEWVNKLKNEYFIKWIEVKENYIVFELKNNFNKLPEWLVNNKVMVIELKPLNNDLEYYYKKIVLGNEEIIS